MLYRRIRDHFDRIQIEVIIVIDSSSSPMISNEEIEAQNLIECGEIDQAIVIYQNIKPESARIFCRIGILFEEKKGDYSSAMHSFQQALRIEEEVTPSKDES